MNENQKYFYFDQSLCTGCDTCLVGCKDWNDVPAGPAFLRRRYTKELGAFPNINMYQTVYGCNHCEKPACIDVCPMGAITKRTKDGAVIVNRDICISCRACKGACPYDAPQFEAADSKMIKCNMCWDRLDSMAEVAEGATSKLPTCVAACPQRAIKFGTLAELKAQGVTELSLSVEGFKYDEGTKPCIRFKRKTRVAKNNSAF